MEPLIIILLVFAVFLIIIYIIFEIIFKSIFKRCDLKDSDIDKLLNNFPQSKEKDLIIESIKTLNSIPKEEVHINSIDNVDLTGYLYLSKESDKIIVFVHGYHSIYKYDFSVSGVDFYKRGYSMLFIDQRAHQKSQGKYTTFGIKERFDLVKWIEYLNKRFANKKIILCGISMGASTVMYALGEKLPENVRCAICDCGYSKPIDIISHTAQKRIGKLSKIVVPMINLLFIVKTGESLNNLSTEETLKNNKIPILIIHGDNDKVVPIEMGYANFKYASERGTMVVGENAGHGTTYIVDKDKYVQALNEFLEKCQVL